MGQWGCAKLVSMYKLCLRVVEERNKPPLWVEESPPNSSERGGLPPAQSQTCRLPFWLTKCQWWHKHKAAQSIKWAPLSSLASLCLKWIKNGSATWSFQVKSVLKWLYWSSSACLWKLATRAHAWDALLPMQKSAVVFDCVSAHWRTAFVREFSLNMCFQSWWVSNLVCCKRILSNW